MTEKKKYRLDQPVEFRQVQSNPRRYGVMFSPSSSRSRFRIVDSGRRYEIRLTDAGTVEYSLDGHIWKQVAPFPSRDQASAAPRFLSFNHKRAGEELQNIRFDMIAVGRGRVVAKEAGTTRIFHLVMDELFRTYEVTGDVSLSADDPTRLEDPPVPGAYWKLDPEFFISARNPGSDRDAFAPPALLRNYSRHPGSLRFQVFSEALLTNSVDATIVGQNAREWHLIDERSPLMLTGIDDLKIQEEDFREIFNKETIKEILREIYAPFRITLRSPLSDSIYTLSQQLWEQIGASIITSMEAWVKSIAGDIGVEAFRGLMKLLEGVTEAIEQWFWREVFDPMAKSIPDTLADYFIDKIAEAFAKAIKQEGFGAIILPANIGLVLLCFQLRDSQALIKKDGMIKFNIQKALEKLKGVSTDNQALNDAIKTLMQRARQAADDPNNQNPLLAESPNPPPVRMPSLIHTRYLHINGRDTQVRHAIDYTRVMDIGVGYSHWSEQWQLQFGGEIHSLLATRPAFAQERYNLIQYRFLNGPVIDGDAFNDGTCNFYMLVKLKEDYPKLKERYTILWIDEQTYFTQRWRMLDPTDDVWGDLFSLSRTIKDNPTWFQFDRAKFWSPFEHHLHDSSRMVVRRQIVAVTGFDDAANRHEIYTICYNYGVSDYTWRWRLYPENTRQLLLDSTQLSQIQATLTYPFPVSTLQQTPHCVFVNSLELRDDATLTVRGFRVLNQNRVVMPMEGRWFQQYLPADLHHHPHTMHLKAAQKPTIGFRHPWQFFSESAYRQADRFYQLGIYEQVIETRCQYYELELMPNENGQILPMDKVVNKIWKNDSGSLEDRLFFNTTNFTWQLNKDEEGYFPLGELVRESHTNDTMSMYEPTTRFRLLEKKPLGLIGIFFDKRDDELQSASHLPREIVLRFDKVEATIPPHFETEITGNDPAGNMPDPPQAEIETIRVLVKRNTRINYPPIVFKATVGPSHGKSGLPIRFWTPMIGDEVNRNIWKIKLAALDQSQVVTIIEVEQFGNFRRVATPDRPLPFDAPRRTVTESDMYCYEYVWKGYDKATQLLINKYCNEEARILYGTSIWFEDILGHRSLPEELTFEV